MGWSREETNGTWRVGRMELMNFPPLVFVMRTHPDGPPLLSPLARSYTPPLNWRDRTRRERALPRNTLFRAISDPGARRYLHRGNAPGNGAQRNVKWAGRASCRELFRLTNDHWDQVGGTAINVRSPIPILGLLLPPPPLFSANGIG